MTKEEAMKLALEALEEIALAGMSVAPEMIDSKEAFHARQAWRFIGIAARALEPVKKALAEQPAPVQQQEPVACDGNFPEGFDESFGIPAQALRQANAALCEVTNNRMWDVPALAERMMLFSTHTTPPAAPVQEPAVLDITIDDDDALSYLRDMVVQSDGDLTPIRLLARDGHSGRGLYVASADYPEEGAIKIADLATSPPAQRKPLTDEFIAHAWANSFPNIGFNEFLALFRSVEAAHGIKE